MVPNRVHRKSILTKLGDAASVLYLPARTFSLWCQTSDHVPTAFVMGRRLDAKSESSAIEVRGIGRPCVMCHVSTQRHVPQEGERAVSDEITVSELDQGIRSAGPGPWRPLLAATLLCWTLLVGFVAAADRQIGIRYIGNSASISQLVDLTCGGMTIGMKEIERRRGLLEMVPFYHDGLNESSVPSLDGFTSLQLQRLSDTGMVVGTAGRVPTVSNGAFQGFIWSETEDRLERLEWLAGYRGSSAFDVSADGRRITGFCVGANPPRIVPCLWELRGGKWKCERIATPRDYNPFLTTGRVVISDDGKTIAACAYDRLERGEFSNYLFIWREVNQAWKRTLQRKGAFHLANVSNDGLIVGTFRGNGSERAFVFDPVHGLRLLELLPGDARSAALDVNNDGTVVGFSDDPYGPTGGPQAFVWTSGKPQPLALPSNVAYSAATCITDKNQIGGYAEFQGAESDSGRTVSFVLSGSANAVATNQPAREDSENRGSGF